MFPGFLDYSKMLLVFVLLQFSAIMTISVGKSRRHVEALFQFSQKLVRRIRKSRATF